MLRKGCFEQSNTWPLGRGRDGAKDERVDLRGVDMTRSLETKKGKFGVLHPTTTKRVPWVYTPNILQHMMSNRGEAAPMHRIMQHIGTKGAQQTSCQGVWIESPSPQLKGPCTEVLGLRVRIPNPRGHTTCVDCQLSLQSKQQHVTIPHCKGIA